ncbi:MAG: cytochrome c biogenesis protein ResB [Thermodesulfobacteriota bacterium]
MKPGNSPSVPPEKKQPIWKSLASVNLTIFLLIFLAVSSIVGTLIPQNEPPAMYIQRYGYGTYQLLDSLSLLDLYHSGWYRLLLLLLVLNLIVCTTDRLRHVWDIVFPKEKRLNENTVLARPGTRALKYKANPSMVKAALSPILSGRLGDLNETIAGSTTILWREKGRLSRLGVYVVHLSIIIFYIAGMASSLGGFRTSVNLPEGAVVEQVPLPNTNVGYNLGFAFRVDKFEAQFYPTGEPKDYRSDVTIIENGQPVFNGNIRVNHPLTYKGITFYQASYGRFPRAVELNMVDKSSGKTLPLSVPFGQEAILPDGLGALRSLRVESNVMDMGPAVQMLLTSPEGRQTDLWIFKNNPDFGRIKQLPYRFLITEIKEGYYTGLQVAKEPGIPFVWAGSILMVVGIAVTFFMSHWKIWVVLERKGEGTTVTIGGQTNKNKLRLEERLDNLHLQLQEADIK